MTSVTRAYRGNHSANVNVLKLIRLLNKRIVGFRNLAEFRNFDIQGLSGGYSNATWWEARSSKAILVDL